MPNIKSLQQKVPISKLKWGANKPAGAKEIAPSATEKEIEVQPAAIVEQVHVDQVAPVIAETKKIPEIQISEVIEPVKVESAIVELKENIVPENSNSEHVNTDDVDDEESNNGQYEFDDE